MEQAVYTHPLYFAFSQALDECLSRYPERNKITVALSGGADSVVLLFLSAAYRAEKHIDLDALYVNHGLSPNADDWQTHCAQVCKRLQVPFTASKVFVPIAARQSLEETARTARYNAFDQHAGPDGVVLLGHHANDQLETVLLRMQRGAGSLGLAGMAAIRELTSGGVCYRPLLSSTRKDIEAFIAQFQLDHIEDESNSDERFSRNFLRNRLIPLWETVQPGLLKAVTRLASLMREQEQLLAEFTQQDLVNTCHGNALVLDKFASLSDTRQRNLLRAFIAEHGLQMPSHAVLLQIQQQALFAKEDAQLQIKLGKHTVRRHKGQLYLVGEVRTCVDRYNVIEQSVDFAGDTLVLVESQKGLRKPRADEQVSIRFNCLNARIHLAHKPGSNTVKHWLKDAGVPAWERPQIPVVFYNETPVQIVGVGCAKEFVTSPGVVWVVEK